MKKTAFKTFVYSFVSSLFVILGTNRAFFATSIQTEIPSKISKKNITLFLKNEDFSPIRAASIPTKKILLSAVSDIPQKQKFATVSSMEESTISDTKNFSEESILPIPLEIINQAPKTEPSKHKQKVLVAKADIQSPQEHPDDLSSKKVVYTPEQSYNKTQPKYEETLFEELPSNSVLAEKNTKFVSEEKENAQKHNQETQIASLLPQDKALSDNEPVNSDDKALTNKAPFPLIPLQIEESATKKQGAIKTAHEVSNTQVALTSQNIPIKSMDAQKTDISFSPEKKNDKKWQTMKEKHAQKVKDDPWVVAKGKKFPTNQMVLQDEKFKISEEEVEKLLAPNIAENDDSNVQLASKTVKNLLIPIPEDILNDENLTPQLISSPENKEIKEELEAKGLIKEEPPIKEEVQEQKDDIEDKASTKETGILDSISSLFSSENKPTEIGIAPDNNEEENNSLLSAFTKKQNKLISKILPTEIRLSFQPNRAEISGQTLKWIKAFAQKTAEEDTTGLEIRIDGTSSPLLQRRRLNLLQNILLSEGASPDKISTVFTAREPNSFILRTVYINKEKMNMPTKSNNRYLQW